MKRFALGYLSILGMTLVCSILFLTIKGLEISLYYISQMYYWPLYRIGIRFEYSKFFALKIFPLYFLPLFLILFLWLFNRPKLTAFQLHALYDLGHLQKIKDKKGFEIIINPEIKKHKTYLELITPNLNIKLDDVIKDIEKYSAQFSIKIARVEKTVNRISLLDQLLKRKKTVSFNFFYDFIDEINANDFTPPKPWHLYMGMNNESIPVLLDLKVNPFIYVGGKSGQGKTITIQNLARALKASTPDVVIIVIDTKGQTYNRKFLDEVGATLMMANTTEEKHKIVSLLKDLKHTITTVNSKIMSETDFEHAEDFHTRNIKFGTPRMLIIMDEAGSYLRVEGSTEEKAVRKDLVELTTYALSQFRSSSIAMIISSQRCQLDELSIPMDNFQARLIGAVPIEMSRKWSNGQVSDKKTPGRWFLNSDEFENFLKTPYKLKVKRLNENEK